MDGKVVRLDVASFSGARKMETFSWYHWHQWSPTCKLAQFFPVSYIAEVLEGKQSNSKNHSKLTNDTFQCTHHTTGVVHHGKQ